jgi:hypothetical protein
MTVLGGRNPGALLGPPRARPAPHLGDLPRASDSTRFLSTATHLFVVARSIRTIVDLARVCCCTRRSDPIEGAVKHQDRSVIVESRNVYMSTRVPSPIPVSSVNRRCYEFSVLQAANLLQRYIADGEVQTIPDERVSWLSGSIHVLK